MSGVWLYVDGYNFYYAIKREFQTKLIQERRDLIGLGWCDFRRLASAANLVGAPEEITVVKYFTAPETEEDPGHNPRGEPQRQANWLAAVKTIPNLQVVEGRHKRWEGDEKRKEKQTDVNIAVEMLLDATSPSGFDRAILLTGDTDLAPAVWAVSNRVPRPKQVTVLLPPDQRDSGWAKYFKPKRGTIRLERITEEMLAMSLLRYEIQAGSGNVVSCPPYWRLPRAYLDMKVGQEHRPDRR
jgi:uncharacterized LabA/DUF88 family protein